MALNETWALDFMADALYGGRWFRTLNVIDEGNRQALGIEVATSIPSARVIRVLDQLIEMHGKPKALRADNVLRTKSTPFTRNRHPGRAIDCDCTVDLRASRVSPTVFR